MRCFVLPEPPAGKSEQGERLWLKAAAPAAGKPGICRELLVEQPREPADGRARAAKTTFVWIDLKEPTVCVI